MEEQAFRSPAEVYDQHFVPALFEPWGMVVANSADIASSERVLDVACGTGALAVTAAQLVGCTGSVVGLDPNNDMLTVARRKPHRIQWREGRAESLPFPDGSFDAVVSQFGFMFFEDQRTALREMMRVLRPGGRMAVAVCDAIDHSPGYAVLAELLHRLFGESVAQAFRAPFACGDKRYLHTLCVDADIAQANVTRHDGPVRFDSIKSLVATERACVWTLGGLLDREQFHRLLDEAAEALEPFVEADGKVNFNMPALIVTAIKT
jgi:ubiquinone/menaquinone biosynthesis C-methylase UbiE